MLTSNQDYDITRELESKTAETAALGALVKRSARKRRFIRALDVLASPVVRGLEWLHPTTADNASGEPTKILVVEYWNLGDIVMLSPFLRSLRIQYPAAHITLLTSPKAAPILEHQSLVDNVVTVRVPWTEHYSRLTKYNPFSPLWFKLVDVLKALRAENMDLAFAARADIRDNFILWFLRVKRRVGYGFGGGAYFLSDRVTPDVRHPHFSYRWLRLLSAVGKKPLVREPRLRITTEEEKAAETILAAHGIHPGDFLVGIHPGARSAVRQWGEENFREVVKGLRKQFPIKTIWFREPGQIVEQRDNILGDSVSLPLRYFMGVLAQCRMLICNDSGPMHIATALAVPVVAIFGPTEPAWFGPLGDQNHVVIQQGFWCRPCFDYCVFDQPYCLRTITVESVLESAVNGLRALFAKETQQRTLIGHQTSNAAIPESKIREE
jgi:lipopolysaccharide heptosyltransferase II